MKHWEPVFLCFAIDKRISAKIDGLSPEAKAVVIEQLIGLMFVPHGDFWGCGEICMCRFIPESVCSRGRVKDFKEALSSANIEIGENFSAYRESMAAYREGYLLGWLFELKRFLEKEIFQNKMDFCEGQDYDAYRAWVMNSIAPTHGGLVGNEFFYIRRFGATDDMFTARGYSVGQHAVLSLIYNAEHRLLDTIHTMDRENNENLSCYDRKSALRSALKRMPEIEAIYFLKEVVRSKEKRDFYVLKNIQMENDLLERILSEME